MMSKQRAESCECFCRNVTKTHICSRVIRYQTVGPTIFVSVAATVALTTTLDHHRSLGLAKKMDKRGILEVSMANTQ